MAECDWVIIPSIWWENSPVVIQEAIAYGRPLIGSNIGGMKEKIEGIAGITFDARSSASLASTIKEAIEVQCFDYWLNKLVLEDCSFDRHSKLICR
jgi:glycosyltransferase involved in cell wall biosynthesis